jgi:hypothetical protein
MDSALRMILVRLNLFNFAKFAITSSGTEIVARAHGPPTC